MKSKKKVLVPKVSDEQLKKVTGGVVVPPGCKPVIVGSCTYGKDHFHPLPGGDRGR